MSDVTLFPLVAAAMVFISIALFFVGLHYYWRYRAERKRLLARIESGGTDGVAGEGAASSAAGLQSIRAFFLTTFDRVGRLVKVDQTTDVKGKRLTFFKAGIRSENAVVAFWGAKYLLGVLFPALYLLTQPLLVRSANPSATLLVCLILVVAGFYLPDLWLRQKVSARKEEIQDGLPDALDLLVVCVEAGMGLDAAMNRVGEEIRLTSPAISDEFKLFNLEVRAGKTKRDALKNLSLRTDLEDVNSLVTMLIQTEKFGTSVAQSLRVYSDAFRTKRGQRAEEIAAKLPVKIILPLVAFIFPSIFVTILGPGVIRIFRVLLKQ